MNISADQRCVAYMSINEPTPPEAPTPVDPPVEPTSPDPEPTAPNPSEPEPFIDEEDLP